MLLCVFCTYLKAQEKSVSDLNRLNFEGQVSFISSYGPNNLLEAFLGGRYLPQLSYKACIDSSKDISRFFDIELSANTEATSLFHPFTQYQNNSKISPYRGWVRYSSSQLEFRLGLQKIDFGPAMLLRPLQWFNQIDPRDPLQLTNGVYAALAKYYFLNNANIWFWVLYGNDERRGFDVFPSVEDYPELGTRIQLPTPKGEIALSYHRRKVSTQVQDIFESRAGIDGKWDVGIGLWFEINQISLEQNTLSLLGLQALQNQSAFNIGMDYTIGIASGLNLRAEHLYYRTSSELFGKIATSLHLSAMTMSYPLSLFDNLSSVLSYNWAEGKDGLNLLINYEHQFELIISYLMLYYNSSASAVGLQQNDFTNQFAGSGIRLMFVYNH